jgi:dipeptidyl aminopeptidase/acylaminoacyl peptidase
MVGFHSYLAAEHGIATLAVNYRCSTGFGTAYMGLPYTCADNAERQDLIGAADFLVASPLIDSNSDSSSPADFPSGEEGGGGGGGLGIHGLSYGAWNAYSALSARPALFAAGVGVSGVSNRAAQQPFVADRDARAGGRNVLPHTLLPAGDRLKYGPFPDLKFPGWTQRAADNSDYLFQKSPIALLENWTTPTLIIGTVL